MGLEKIFDVLGKNASTILTVTSVIGVISTAITASNDTVYAKHILNDELGIRNVSVAIRRGNITRGEVVKETWKCYIPTAIVGAVTIGCIIGSHYCSAKQKIALSNAYILSQTTLQEYQRKVAERIGENKERAIRDDVRRSIADSQALPCNYISESKEAIQTGHGNSLIYDVPSDTYFKSDINFLKASTNDMNARMLGGSEPYLDYNDIRSTWGLPWFKLGSEMIVTPERLLELHFDPEMMENGEVRINLDYELYPKYEYLRR